MLCLSYFKKSIFNTLFQLYTLSQSLKKLEPSLCQFALRTYWAGVFVWHHWETVHVSSCVRRPQKSSFIQAMLQISFQG